MSKFLILAAEMAVAVWAGMLCVAAIRSVLVFGYASAPGPFQLIGMLWRGEVGSPGKKQADGE